jgi:hypothetical protein
MRRSDVAKSRPQKWIDDPAAGVAALGSAAGAGRLYRVALVAFVDGRCRFVAGYGDGRDYHRGALDADEAAALTSESAWQKLPQFDGYKGESCADCGYMFVSEGSMSP